MRLTTTAAIVAAAHAIAASAPVAAQERPAARPPARIHPYVVGEVGVGTARLDCGDSCGYATTGVSRALGAGFAVGSAFRVGGEYVQYEDVVDWTPNAGHAQATLLAASVAPLATQAPRLELRLALGVARLQNTDRNVGRNTVDPHAPVYRVGLGYAIGGGHWRFVPAADVLRTFRRHPAEYRTMRFDVGVRWQP